MSYLKAVEVLRNYANTHIETISVEMFEAIEYAVYALREQNKRETTELSASHPSDKEGI